MAKKIKVGILFGGRSAEHEVSLQSAKNVIEALDKNKYEPVLIGIDKNGHWYPLDSSNFLIHADDPKKIQLNISKPEVALVARSERRELVSMSDGGSAASLDVIFPVLHGTYGEDGTMQGLLKLADIPFVGAGVLGSSVGMDKDVMKRLLRDANLPIGQFKTVHSYQRDETSFSKMKSELGLPMFVKPANAGSSVGISKVKSESDFVPALDLAFQYDKKILIEEGIPGREIEVSVLGNDQPIASLPGEIVVKDDFYSYEAKYINAEASYAEIPAKIPASVVKEVQRLAIETYRALCCEGMARVDFFLKSDNTLLINEINTLPGFTRISMYPKMWAASGLAYSDLIDRLIQLAIERYQSEKNLKTTF